MKHNGKNIITSDDITMKNSGQTLEEIISNLRDDTEKLKSNVKWIYKYGGVGSGSGGGGGTSTAWTFVSRLGDIQLSDNGTVLFDGEGWKSFYLHINNPRGDSFIATIKTGTTQLRVTLNLDNAWTYADKINVKGNDSISISIMDGNALEKGLTAYYITSAYSFNAYFVDNDGNKYPLYLNSVGEYEYSIFTSNIREKGLRFVVIYDSSVDTTVTYKYKDFKGNTSEYISKEIHEGEIGLELFNVEVMDNILSITDIEASYYIFNAELLVGGETREFSLPADIIPEGLYLKVIPTSGIIYQSDSEVNPYLYFTGDINFRLTPYYGAQNSGRNINCEIKLNDETVIRTSLKERSTTINTVHFDTAGTNKVDFIIQYGNSGITTITYYIYTKSLENVLDWTRYKSSNNTLIWQNYYRYNIGNSDNSFKNSSQELLGRIILSTNGEEKTYYGTGLPNGLPAYKDMVIHIGIQYNEINDDNDSILEIFDLNDVDLNKIVLKQNSLTLGDTQLEIYIEKESDYDILNTSNFHLISLVRKFLGKIGDSNAYELSVYIDGILEKTLGVYYTIDTFYNSVKFLKANYCVNLFEIDLIKSGEVNSLEGEYYWNLELFNDSDVVRFWYCYRYYSLRLRDSQDNPDNLEDITLLQTIFEKDFNVDQQGHIRVSDDAITNLAKSPSVSMLVFEYNTQINNLKFFEWSDVSYGENEDIVTKEVGVIWAHGFGLELKNTAFVIGSSLSYTNVRFNLDILGSSTRGYVGKNYDLSVKDIEDYKLIYTPNYSEDGSGFLPENSFTLKADIVDSSHSNNTCMGKFINEQTQAFSGALQINQYSSNIKNCLVGFPTLLFVKEIDGENVKYYYLGIYNFNLGRNSYFNLGYCDLNALSGLQEGFTIYGIDRNEYLPKSSFIVAEVLNNKPYWDFSQYDSSILFKLSTVPNDSGYMFGDIIPKDGSLNNKIRDFVRKVSKAGGYIFQNLGKEFNEEIELDYTYMPNHIPDAGKLYERYWDGNEGKENFRLLGEIYDFNSNHLVALVKGEEDSEGVLSAPGIDYRSLVEYYTICMAFGMLDSVLKNLNIKSWNNGNTFYLAFYDMDTCLGVDNNGENSQYYAFSDYWDSIDSDPDSEQIYPLNPVTVYRDYSPKKSPDGKPMFDIPSSYLFAVAKYAQSINLAKNLGIDYLLTPEDLWALWRSSNGVLSSAKKFINNYYKGYMSGISEIMFNFNYRAKYYRFGNGSFNSGELSRFKGRRLGYVTNWLDKRFHMVDAYLNLADLSNILVSQNTQDLVFEDIPNTKTDSNLDVFINKDLFGGNKSFTTIDIVVSAPDYTPNIISSATSAYRYLLKDSNKKYRITFNNTGNNKWKFGGSQMWNYLDSINTLASGDSFVLQSNRLTFLNGNSGEINGFNLTMPALREIHLNSRGYKGSLDFIAQNGIDNYPNLDIIDVSSSSIQLRVSGELVRTINLSNIVSQSVDIGQCYNLLTVNLSNVSLKKLTINPVTWTNNLTLTGTNINEADITAYLDNNTFTILNDNSIQTLQLQGFAHIIIRNCPKLKTIVSSGNSLKDISVRNAESLNSVELNVKSCTSIDLLGASSLTILKLVGDNNSFANITTLDLSKSRIKAINYYENNLDYPLYTEYSNNSKLYLSCLTGLLNFYITNNPEVTEIYFNNSKTNPIPIKGNGFSDCSKLYRIYGHISVLGSYTFNNCGNFTIHGDLETLWKGKLKVNGGVVQMPYQLLNKAYNEITSDDLFSEVTNITFNTSSLSYFGNLSGMTLFDVYYCLNKIWLDTQNNSSLRLSLDHTFYVKTPIFNYLDGNSPNRYMFYGCSCINQLTYAFNNNAIILYSPTLGLNDGLFSPLVNLEGMSVPFSSTTYFDKDLFKRTGSLTYPLKNISYFYCGGLGDFSNYVLGDSLQDYLVSGAGNFGNFFKSIPYVETIRNAFNFYALDFDTLDLTPLVSSLKNIQGSFKVSYGTGTLDFDQVFGSNNFTKVESISNSFTVGNVLAGFLVEMPIKANMFKRFPNIKYIGYESLGGNIGGVTNIDYSNMEGSLTFGFSGEGLHKYIEGEFPTSIVNGLSLLKTFVGFFSNVLFGTIDFPGDMFTQTPQLENIAGLFLNASGTMTLTSRGFALCPNLTNVSRLFYVSENSRGYIQSSIPNKFFYHGETNNLVMYYGFDSEEDFNLYLEDPENHTPSSLSVTKITPNAKIVYALECFYGLDNMTPYQYNGEWDYTIPNKDYIPFAYYYTESSSTWKLRESKDIYTKPFDISYIYDGGVINNLPNNVLCRDTKTNVSTLIEYASTQYICPPDMLLYFNNTGNLNLRGFFKWCGRGASDTTYEIENKRFSKTYSELRFKGRICPYMFDSLTNLTHIPEFFAFCKGINFYTYGLEGQEVTEIFPHELFEKANKITCLAGTFEGMWFTHNPNSSFLTSLLGELDIRGIFSMCCYNEGVTMSGMFANKKLSSISGAFTSLRVTLRNSTSEGRISLSTSDLALTEHSIASTYSDNIALSKTYNQVTNPNISNVWYLYYRIPKAQVTETGLDNLLIYNSNVS